MKAYIHSLSLLGWSLLAASQDPPQTSSTDIAGRMSRKP